jgi:hypothetical protein
MAKNVRRRNIRGGNLCRIEGTLTLCCGPRLLFKKRLSWLKLECCLGDSNELISMNLPFLAGVVADMTAMVSKRSAMAFSFWNS